MFTLLKTIQSKLTDWCLSKQEITCKDLHELTDIKSCEIYDEDSHELKFIEQGTNTNILVETPSGYSPLKYSRKTVPYQIYEITTTSYSIKCADEHRLISETNTPIYAKDLKIGDNLKTKTGIEQVIDTKIYDEFDNMYDLELDDEDHVYYTNNLLSHNSAVSAAYIFWFAMFKPDKFALIVAHLNDLAMEMITRIRHYYENCPNFLKAGIQDGGYNKHEIAFDNGSRIKSVATSENSGRGTSVSLLYCDEFAFVRSSVADEFWASIQPTLACVTGDTLVLTDQGYIRIDEFHKDKNIGDYFEIQDTIKIIGKDGLEDISHGYVSPESETLIIETEKGHIIETTHNHPLYSLCNEIPSMVKSKELTTNNYLRIDYGMNIFNNSCNIKNDMAYFMGLYIAEGWFDWNKRKDGSRYYYGITISNSDIDIISFLIEKMKFKKVRHRQYKYAKSSVDLVQELQSYGINPTLKCYNKQVPSKILTSTKSNICSFLRGYFDGDGGCDKNRGISAYSTSRKLIQEIQLLLNNLGIISYIVRVSGETRLLNERKTQRLLPQGKPVQSLRDGYTLYIPLSESLKFRENIGFTVKHKQENLNHVIATREQNNNKLYKIPYSIIKNKIEDILQSTGKTKYWFRYEKGIRFEHKTFITKEWLNNFKNILIDEDLYVNEYDEFFNELLNYNCIWDKIRSITPSTNKTYDFTVPKTHTFLQNGILGSNTGGSCIISSTPNGTKNLFAQLWRDAVKGDNNFSAVRVHWNEPPNRDDEFRKDQISKIGEARWRQEFLCEFLSMDKLLISPLTIQDLEAKVYEPIAVTGRYDFNFWKSIKKYNTYLIGVDPSTGTGEDYSIIQIFSFPELDQIGMLRSNEMTTPQLYNALKSLILMLERLKCKIYFSIENNGLGEGLLALYQSDEDPVETAELISDSGAKRLGMYTSKQRKLKSCIRFKEWLEDGDLTINSPIVLEEIQSFIRTGDSYAADKGATDDTISAILIIVQLMEELAEFEDEAFSTMYTQKEMATELEYENDSDEPMGVVI